MLTNPTSRFLDPLCQVFLIASALVSSVTTTVAVAENPVSASEVVEGWRTTQDTSRMVQYTMEGTVRIPARSIGVLDEETYVISSYAPKTDYEFDFKRVVSIEPLKRRLKIKIDSQRI